MASFSLFSFPVWMVCGSPRAPGAVTRDGELLWVERRDIGCSVAKNPPSQPQAGWQSGHAAACKAVYAGSIPTPASTQFDEALATMPSGISCRATFGFSPHSRGRALCSDCMFHSAVASLLLQRDWLQPIGDWSWNRDRHFNRDDHMPLVEGLCQAGSSSALP